MSQALCLCHKKPDQNSFFIVALDFISSVALLIVPFLMSLTYNNVPYTVLCMVFKGIS